jgi:hypothetical protein
MMGDSVRVLMLEPPSLSTVLQPVAGGQIDQTPTESRACEGIRNFDDFGQMIGVCKDDRILYSV